MSVVKVIGGWYPCQLTHEITHADTTAHSTDMFATGVPKEASVIFFTLTRSVGTGDLEISSSAGGTQLGINDDEVAMWFRGEDGLFHYELETANDDVNCEIMGYFVQGSLARALRR